jgi:hypothetical protein
MFNKPFSRRCAKAIFVGLDGIAHPKRISSNACLDNFTHADAKASEEHIV